MNIGYVEKKFLISENKLGGVYMKKRHVMLQFISSIVQEIKRIDLNKKVIALLTAVVLFFGGVGPVGAVLTGHSLEEQVLKSERAEGEPEKEQHAKPVVMPLGEVVMGKDIVVQWEPIPTATNGYVIVLRRLENNTLYNSVRYTFKDWQINTQGFTTSDMNVGNVVFASVYALSTPTHDLSESGSSGTAIVQRGVAKIVLTDQVERLTDGVFEIDHYRIGGGAKQFSSSDPNVATIDEEGMVTPISVGNTTITITVEEDRNFLGSTASANLEIKNSHVVVSGLKFEDPVAGKNLEITWDRVPSAEKGYRLEYYDKNRKWKTKKIAQPQSGDLVSFTLKGTELVKRKKFQVRIKAIETPEYLEAALFTYSKKKKVATPPKPSKPQKPKK